MTNADLCHVIFQMLEKFGVNDVVICAGARNAPLVMQFTTQKFKIHSYFEERSAAFFSLGLLKACGKPVAIVTTSGTAVAELLPAVIESYYQGRPLILITADRPKSYRNSGSPQTINQVGLFSHYVEQTLDLDLSSTDLNVTTRLDKPVHLNVCFDEPLFDTVSVEPKVGLRILPSIKKNRIDEAKIIQDPLVIVGALEANQISAAKSFLEKWDGPTYLESLSQLKSFFKNQKNVLNATDQIIPKLFREGVCQSVIRIGGIPTLRFWRDLEFEFKTVPVFNFSDLDFSGLSRPSENYELDMSRVQPRTTAKGVNVAELDSKLSLRKKELLEKFPLSEPAFIHHLSRKIKNEPLYLGNSLPIREWDLFAELFDSMDQTIFANRGANGIDGQVSTYLGWASNKPQSWCLVGDLTALYDLAALGLKRANNKSRVVVMNNFGGQIFNRVFKNDDFLNVHEIEFSAWAKLWKWDYLQIVSVADFSKLEKASANTVIELQPNANQTKSFWELWDLACKEI